MRNFVLGVVTTLVVLALGAGALLLSLRPDVAPPLPTPGIGAPPSTTPPSDLPSGATWLSMVEFTSSDVLTDAGAFRDVAATGRGVTVSDNGIDANQLNLEATLTWAAAAEQVGEGVELYAAGSGLAGFSRTVTALGQDIPVKGTGHVRAEGGLLVIEPETIDLSGPNWLDSVASTLVRNLVTIRQPVAGVPDGMRLTRVQVVDSGFRTSLEGRDLSITQ